jgi:Gnt-I system high-affinity gluconate transporter
MQLVIIVLAIGLQIFLTYKKVSPFLSLLIVALLAGLAFGMQPDTLLKAVKAV